LKVNGEAVCGTKPGPIQEVGWCRSTAKPGKVYLHVFDWPEGGQIRVSGLGKITAAYLLGDPSQAPLSVGQEGDEVTVAGPAEAPDAIDTLIVLNTAP
ncbi:MAG TPA: alpha-L-fucosidase, partial [Anaerolineae bacterium]|nr:alpha-L-fucosidase [Anaerolineae bacterium]